MEEHVDNSILVYAPKEVQLARLISRDGNNESLANDILNQQMDIEDKKTKRILSLITQKPKSSWQRK